MGMNKPNIRQGAAAVLGVLSLVAAACAPTTPPPPSGGTQPQVKLSGLIKVDGSSTVFPITEAMAEEFQKANKDVKVTVGISGTGGGFQKFCSGDTDLQNASRAISKTEQEACAKNNIVYIEMPVGYDGIAVVVNPQNTFATCLTVAELKKIWEPEAQGKVTNWKQVRDSFPDVPLKLYGAGSDSGTFDYFTLGINGKEKASRGDYTPSEDDNVLVQGVSGDRNAMGYFGASYYEENKSKLKAVQIDSKGDGKCLGPEEKVIQDFSYHLSRPVFVYAKASMLERPEVKEFVKFYLESKNATKLIKEVGMVPLTASLYGAVQKRVDAKTLGTAYIEGTTAKTPLTELFK